MFNTLSTGALSVALAAVLAGPAVAEAQQESKSAPLARQLTQLLDASKVSTIAAADPSGGFVAALYIPGTQLMVVSGKFQTPDSGIYRLEKQEYRELYMDLMGGAVPGSRQVATDVSCDGFAPKPRRDVPADTWEQGDKTQSFEGSRKAKLTDEAYQQVYTAADTQYARILEILLAQAKPKSGGLEVAPNLTGGLN